MVDMGGLDGWVKPKRIAPEKPELGLTKVGTVRKRKPNLGGLTVAEADKKAIRTVKATKHRDRVLKKFEQEFGRDQILKSLVIAQDQDPRCKQLLEMMTDPMYARLRFAKLTERCNLTLMEFLEFSRKSYQAVAIARASQHAPVILNDIALDAMNTMGKCENCKARGKVDDAPCWACDGTGLVKVPGDKGSRDQFLEATGIIQRKGATFAVNQQFNNVPGMNPFESTVARATKALEE